MLPLHLPANKMFLLRYLEGGVDSGFKTVDPDAFEKRLFQVKGRKNIRIAQVGLFLACHNLLILINTA